MSDVCFSGIKRRKPNYKALQDLFDPDDSFNRYHNHPGRKMRTINKLVFQTPSVDRNEVHVRNLRVMLSYGMSGKTEKEVNAAVDRCIAFAKQGMASMMSIMPDGVCIKCEFLDNWKCEAPDNAHGIGRLYFLGNAIVGMDTIDAIVIDPELYNCSSQLKWPKGCRIEYSVAKLYDIPILNDLYHKNGYTTT